MPQMSGNRGKIDKVALMQMRASGWTYQKIADHFGCQKDSVIKMKKRIMKLQALPPDYLKLEVHSGDMDALSQLGQLNRTIVEELDRARRLVIREDEKVREREDLEEKVKKDPKNTILIAELKEKAHTSFANILKIQSNVIDISAEVRKQIELQLKIAETLYSATMIAKFQEEVLNAIGKIDPFTRDAIIKELKQQRTLRGLMQPKKV
jgi:hypothetical protein